MNSENKRFLLFSIFFYVSFFLYSQSLPISIINSSAAIGTKKTNTKVPSSLVAKTKEPITVCEWAPDGKSYYSSWENTLVVWDAETNKPAHICSNIQSPVVSLSFSKDGKYFITVTEDNTVIISYTQNYAEVSRISGIDARNNILAAKMLNDNYSIAIPLDGKTLYNCFRLILTGNFVTAQKDGHKKNIYSIDVNRSNGYIITAGEDKKVNIWDSKSYELLTTIAAYTSSNLPVVFSPNGESFIVPVAADLISIKNIFFDTLLDIQASATPVHKIVYSPDSLDLAFPVKTGGILIYDTETGEELKSLDYPTIKDEKFGIVTSLAYSPDGNYIIGGTSTGCLIRWSLGGKVFTQSQAKTEERQMLIDSQFEDLKASEEGSENAGTDNSALEAGDGTDTQKGDSLSSKEAAEKAKAAKMEKKAKKAAEKEARKEAERKLEEALYYKKASSALSFCLGYTNIPTDYFIGDFDFDIAFQKSFNKLPLFAAFDVKLGGAIPKKDFPYNYYTEAGVEMTAPYLYTLNPQLSFGYEAYGIKGIRVFFNICGGASFRMMWNNSIKNSVTSSFFYGFFGGFSAGIDIKGFTVKVSCVYDSDFELQNSLSLGWTFKFYHKDKEEGKK